MLHNHYMSRINANYRDPFAVKPKKDTIVRPADYFFELLKESRSFRRQYGYTRRIPRGANGGYTVEWVDVKGEKQDVGSDWWKYKDSVVDKGVAYLRLESEIYNIVHVKILYVDRKFGGQGIGRRAMEAIVDYADKVNEKAEVGYKFAKDKYFEDDDYLALQLCPNPMDAMGIIPPKDGDWTRDFNFEMIRDECHSSLGQYNDRRLTMEQLIEFYSSFGFVRADERRFKIIEKDGKRYKVPDMYHRSFEVDRPVLWYPERHLDKATPRWE